MKILHTSDWHLGSQICGRKRYEEHEQFLHWLLALIEREGIELLIVAGDIFDSSTPPNRSLELYYQFLGRTARSCCRQVIITAGNHDSPSLISAPRELCNHLNITVVGSIPDDPKELVLTMQNHDSCPELIICPIPYLRDRDIRTTKAGESASDKTANLIAGISSWYHQVLSCAESSREDCGIDIPILSTGHLFVAGGTVREDDGSRDLYLGNLACIRADAFPACIDYMALGHLHLPQKVGGNERFRYSGAPLPMGFGEAGQQKSVLIIETGAGRSIQVKEVPVPVFQEIMQIRDSFDGISDTLARLKMEGRLVVAEIILDDQELIPDAQEKFREMTQGTGIEVLRVKNMRDMSLMMQDTGEDQSLDDLSAEEVFLKRLDAADIGESERLDLIESFREIEAGLFEEDSNAE